MPTKKPRLAVYVSPQEQADIEKRRKAAGLGMSEYLRRCALAEGTVRIPCGELITTLVSLLHTLRRIGGLYRMELSNEERFAGHDEYRQRIVDIHDRISGLADSIETKIMELKD